LRLILPTESRELYQVQSSILEKIESTRNDYDIIRLALLSTLPPIADYTTGAEILQAATPNCFEALVIGAFLNVVWVYNKDNAPLNMLFDHLKLLDNEQQAIIWYLQALNQLYRDVDPVNSLETSVKTYERHVNNYLELSKRVSPLDSSKYLKIAHSNIRQILSPDDFSRFTVYDYIEPMFYIKRHITGVVLDKSQYDSVKWA